MTAKEALNITSKDELRAWMRDASDSDLDQFINGCSAANNFWTYATAERQRRQLAKLTKPHWTVIWTFILVVVAVVISVLAWLFPR